jgi:hypothetical protein
MPPEFLKYIERSNAVSHTKPTSHAKLSDITMEEVRVPHESPYPQAPDLIEPIFAWKYMNIVDGVPYSPIIARPYKPGKTQRAYCFRRYHQAPNDDCHCGIHLVPWYDSRISYSPVTCLFAAWGKVCEHEGGWRAEYTSPIALVITNMNTECFTMDGLEAAIKSFSFVPGCIAIGLQLNSIERDAVEAYARKEYRNGNWKLPQVASSGADSDKIPGYLFTPITRYVTSNWNPSSPATSSTTGAPVTYPRTVE